MHGAALAEETRAKLLEDPVDAGQNAAKILDVLRIVRSVATILVERSRIVKLGRRATDAHFDSQSTQGRHVFGVEIGDGTRKQRNVAFVAFAGAGQELMRDQVEIHFKSADAKWNRR